MADPLDLWNHWSIQILVLFSLALQFFLFFFSRTRRRGANPVLRFVIWQAYLMADSTAIYALGHLSVIRSSKAVEQQQLAAFWASFLLLHLGGPDSMTAYALQDNQLWLRHLQILAVQVLGAAYVLYKLITANGMSSVVRAAILMSSVGVVKYWEKILALKCGNMDDIRRSIKKEEHAKHYQFHAQDGGYREGDANKEELYVRRAHSLFIVCKHAIVDSWIEAETENHTAAARMLRNLKEDCKGMWTLMEVELSLMYDIMYTKAAMIYTWQGYCIRVASPLTIVASFLLFQFSAKDGHTKNDVIVTYTLLAGAFFLETTSLLSALGSTWTYAFLCATRWSWLQYAALCTGRWDRLHRLVARPCGGRARRWSGEMGQYNMLHFTRQKTAFSPLLGRLAKMVWLKELWNKKHYSGTVEISDELRKWLFDYIKRLPSKVNSQGVLRKKWGRQSLENSNLLDRIKEKYLGVELQEGIIIWHIGTDVFIAKSSRDKTENADLLKAVRTLSDYMMFLLVDRPYMLPGLAQTRLYQRTCNNLINMWKEKGHSSHSLPGRNISTMLKELFSWRDAPNSSRLMQRDKLASILYDEHPRYSVDVPRLSYANKLAKKLLEIEEERGSRAMLEVIRDMWMDFLVYAANRCSRESHAKGLSRGGELTTVLWLMADHLHQHFLNKSKPEPV